MRGSLSKSQPDDSRSFCTTFCNSTIYRKLLLLKTGCGSRSCACAIRTLEEICPHCCSHRWRGTRDPYKLGHLWSLDHAQGSTASITAILALSKGSVIRTQTVSTRLTGLDIPQCRTQTVRHPRTISQHLVVVKSSSSIRLGISHWSSYRKAVGMMKPQGEWCVHKQLGQAPRGAGKPELATGNNASRAKDRSPLLQ